MPRRYKGCFEDVSRNASGVPVDHPVPDCHHCLPDLIHSILPGSRTIKAFKPVHPDKGRGHSQTSGAPRQAFQQRPEKQDKFIICDRGVLRIGLPVRIPPSHEMDFRQTRQRGSHGQAISNTLNPGLPGLRAGRHPFVSLAVHLVQRGQFHDQSNCARATAQHRLLLVPPRRHQVEQWAENESQSEENE